MMMPNEESSKISIDDYGSSRLLHDIEEISKALYFPPHDQTSKKPNYMNENLLPNQKKSSIWKWKPLKALNHIRNQKLSSSFFLHVHSIEGLPLNFNDLSLCVYWKRKNEVLKTRSIRVKDGFAGFEETLIHRCLIYIGKTDPDNVAKYEPKLSLLYVSIIGAQSLDLGKHWIDLTKFLPLTLMELEDEKNRNGKWKTSFKLTGKAKGAVINVSFGFSLSGNLSGNLGKIPDKESGNLGKIPDKESGNLGWIQDRGNGTSYDGMLQRVRSIPSNSRRRTHASSLSFNMKSGPSISLLYQLLDDPKPSSLNEVCDDEFTVVDKGVEFDKKDQDFVKSDESSFIETINVAELFAGDEDNNEINSNLETETDLDDNLDDNFDDNLEDNLEELELFLENLSTESPELDFSFHKNPFLEDDYRGEIVRSRSLDDLTKTVVNDFMNFLGSDSEPESPRERLLRQFEKETQTVAKENFVFNLDIENEEERDTSNVFDSSFLFQEPEETRVGPVTGAEVSQSLISRRKAKILENLETEALMEKWGLNERAFQNSPRTNSGAFGSPVYCSPERPPELPPIGHGLGSCLKMENGGFLRSMSPLVFKRAKNGERLIVQVSKSVVLPLSMGSNGVDIMRKWATIGSEKMGLQIMRLMPMDEITGKRLEQFEMEVLERRHALIPESETPTTTCHKINSKYISMDNIAPLAIEKIQNLLIEGLRIQSGIPTEEPPSSISINSTSTNNTDIEELLNMSTSLHDSHGHFSNFTLALRLLLRDPFRDYEPVGIPMLALINVEKDQTETTIEIQPVFKITEVHVTGFKTDLQKNRSGSRWLYSSGLIGKMKRYTFSKSNALVKSSIKSMNMKHEETFWSISSYIHGEELSGMSLYVRNPDIVFK